MSLNKFNYLEKNHFIAPNFNKEAEEWFKMGAFDNLKKAQDGYSLAEGQLIKQAISTALISKTIAEKLKVNDKYLIFTASLLKDIGKLIM